MSFLYQGQRAGREGLLKLVIRGHGDDQGDIVVPQARY